MPDFEFVHLHRPGDEKKHSTTIRRHVMKEIGLSRRKPKKPAAPAKAKTSPTAVPVAGADSHNRGSSDRSLIPSPVRNSKFNPTIFPVEMDEERRLLARHVFSAAQTTYHPFRTPWLALALHDDAAWYITLAYAALARHAKVGTAFTQAEVTKWYSLCLNSIRRRLADPKERKTEGLISAITGIVCHDNSLGNFALLEIHLLGLKGLVNDIGGINRIAHPILRLMISWYDLAGASYRDGVPYFDIPKHSIIVEPKKDDIAYMGVLLGSWNRPENCRYRRDIQTALHTVVAVANYVNPKRQGDKFWMDDLTGARLLAFGLHRVLSLGSLELPSDPMHKDYEAMATREAFRMASLIFLVSLRAGFGGTSYELPRHLKYFRQVMKPPPASMSFIPELHLWVHIITALEEEDVERRSWHVSEIVRVMENARFTSSKHVFDLVRGIVWVDALYAHKVKALAREIDSLLAVWRMDLQLTPPEERQPAQPRAYSSYGNQARAGLRAF